MCHVHVGHMYGAESWRCSLPRPCRPCIMHAFLSSFLPGWKIIATAASCGKTAQRQLGDKHNVTKTRACMHAAARAAAAPALDQLGRRRRRHVRDDAVSTCRHQLAACHGAPAPSSSSVLVQKRLSVGASSTVTAASAPTSMHAALGASKAGTLQTSISVAWGVFTSRKIVEKLL
jgi:hypothetical protein